MPSSAAQTAPDERARLSAIYREHFEFVWRSLRRLGAPEHALDDATQDVFLVAARRLDDFEGRSSVRTWLFGIAMRVVRTQRRSSWRHRRKVEALAAVSGDSPPGDPMAQRDAQRLLLSLLDQLDDDKRAVYVLAELEGMTAVEIAEGLGAKVNTIYTRLRAARQQLRAAAAKHLEGATP
ncbi:MAG: sigma-70 family RNA polymerase sigma factor [Enhygromyxa sp.]